MALTCIDRGGTFTDIVTFLDDGSVQIGKVPSDRAIVGDMARGALRFGTTVATNALLERRVARTLLLVTEGFEDLPWIRDMTRPALFDPDARWPAPLSVRVHGVHERVDARGRVVVPLTLPDDIDLDGIESVAVALAHGPAAPEHEVAIASWLRDLRPGLPVSLGHRVDPEVGYLARIDATLVDAAVTPVLRAALDRDRIPDGSQALRSDGSLTPAESLRAPEAVLSGPAGGVLAVAEVARMAGFERAVGLDMGGTSTDVCRVDAGQLPRREGHLPVAGVHLRRPMLEVVTIAAGGGSILTNDGRRLAVGPESAGANPGPQCTGRGGPPTLTDAALVAGLVDPAAFDPPLDASLVELPGDARAFLEVARESMAGAVRRIATARGIDVADHALVAYGGAAGQHAADVAARLGIQTVLVHPCAGVLSAWGQALARREEQAVEAVWSPLDAAWSTIGARVHTLRARLLDLGTSTVEVDVRVAGTDHALTLDWSPHTTLAELRTAFARAHRQRYGFDRTGAEIELVNVRVRTAAPPPSAPPSVPGFGVAGPRPGPCLITSPTTAVWVPRGWRATERDGVLRLDHVDAPPVAPETVRTPLGVALWGSRFMAVAEQAGEVLRRLARSVNIRERRDFSCAIFDGDGNLVANAPHIPVHLGAMGETVRDLLRSRAHPDAGQSWLTNDPGAGGSHLPDLTVVTAVVHDGQRFFVASRGHHVDVGGITPGSMPPHSESLAQEGFVVRHLPLLDRGTLRPDLADLLHESRAVATVIADLEAQVAANHHAATHLADLGPGEVLTTWMRHLQDVAGEAVEDAITDLRDGGARDTLAGLPLQLRVRADTGLILDWSGTGGPHPGNLNAPSAVVRAATLYALRVLVDRPIPLNEGATRRVVQRIPSPSLLDPPPGAAVAGGNVETSQRLVDLLFRALGYSAAGPGSMSNLTLGGDGWSFYETLGGGGGASERGPGDDARQLHMTNTRATDIEVLERRTPVRVLRFARRPGTGGGGRHRGGDGLVREIELLEGGSAALLAAWRPEGAPGLDGGGPGRPGRARVRIGGRWRPWDGAAIALGPGDRVCVETPGGGGWGA